MESRLRDSSACGGSRKRLVSTPPQCDPPGGLFSTRNLVEYGKMLRILPVIGYSPTSREARTLAHYLKEPGKLPDSFKIHLLKTVVKLQRLMAGSCDNVILLFLGQADELNSVTRYTDGEVSVLRLLRMSLCI